MTKYKKYKPSGVEWIGDIPEHWKVKKLKYVAQANPSNIDKKSKEDEKEVRLCNYVDVYKNDFIDSKIDFMRATASDNQIEKFTLNKGDVIATRDSETSDDIGNAALVVDELTNVVCGYHLTHIKPIQMNGNYLFRIFQTRYLNSYFEISANGVTRFGLGVDKFNVAPILLPCQEEQIQIANYLDRKTAEIDDLIAKKEQLIKLLEEEKTAVINEAVTKGINPNAKLKDSGIEWLGKIPEHWEVKKLKWLITIGSGEGIKSEAIKEFGAYPVYGGNGILGYSESFNNSDKVFIIGRVGAKCGNVRLVSDKKWISDNALLAYAKGNLDFLMFTMQNLNLNNLANKNAQPLITSTMVKEQIIAYPSIGEQTQIVNHIQKETTRIDKTIETTKNLIELLKEYRTALISEAVTGKIKVFED